MIMKQQIDDVLTKAVELHASDIHLTIDSPPVFRINGDLKRFGSESIDEQFTMGVAQATIPDKLFSSFKEHGQIDYSYDVPRVARFRVNAFQQRGVTSLAFRTIPTEIPTIESLYMPGILKTLAETKQGLLLITGPTGSGKSTTLASMIDYLNQTSRKHILTLEDPIEYMHSHGSSIIDQREVGFDAASFADGLRAALRQDPDVILVGEMRDLETISTAITAAETGHLVLATLHTWSAASTIDRIIDVFPYGQQAQIRVQLAGVLTGVLSQRLLPTKDRKGRRAATELMINNAAVANLIRSEKVHQIPNVIQTNRALGMHMMNTSVKELLDNGIISYDTAEPYLQEES